MFVVSNCIYNTFHTALPQLVPYVAFGWFILQGDLEIFGIPHESELYTVPF